MASSTMRAYPLRMYAMEQEISKTKTEESKKKRKSIQSAFTAAYLRTMARKTRVRALPRRNPYSPIT